jgi:phosphoacetylglucosamine mutase
MKYGMFPIHTYTKTFYLFIYFRPSCPELVKHLESGLEVSGAQSKNYGVLTTPMLHYLVRCLNTAGTSDAYGEPSAEGYYKKLSDAYKTAVVMYLF